MRRTSAPLALLATLAVSLTGCGGADSAGDGADAAMDSGDAGTTAIDTDAPRVAVSPTGPETLPPAIVGEGGELQGADVAYFDDDPATRGYLAVPEGAGPFPSLVIIHEWDGLKDRVRQVADDLAAEGYVTLAADLFSGRTGDTPDENRALVQEARENMENVIANLDAAVAFLRARDDVTGRVGAMGWCFGGGIALSFGLDGVNHEATAIFYGSLVDDPERLAAMDHEVYGTFAEEDGGIPPAAVRDFEAALESAGIENDIHIYDDVNHGFWLRVDGAPETRTEPALDAWQRLKAYLDRTVGSGDAM